MGTGKQKIYVVDTNILMSTPNAMFGFGDNKVVITGTTLQELDKHKTDSGERGYNTRETIRILDAISKRGNIKEGIETYEGGSISVYVDEENSESLLPKEYSLTVPDNRIINDVLLLEQKKMADDIPVILVTNDVSMRVNARICGASVESYKNETVETKELYRGRQEIYVGGDAIDAMYSGENNSAESLLVPLEENEYVILKTDDGSGKSLLGKNKRGTVVPLNEGKLHGFNNIKGRNAAQKMLIDALLAPAEEIPLVIAIGPAGTGKTLLAIACGLEKTYNKRGDQEYEQVLITRTNVQSDNDLGFLPGTLEEKMGPLVAPFSDNMLTIFAGKERDVETARQQIEFVQDKEIVKICAVGYMRGRSISNSFLIVDEAQNMSVHQALEIVSRAGMGTKVVLLGDPDQIDAKYLDKRSNGLVFTAERMKGSSLCAQVTFDKEESVRSPLAMEAASRMTIG